MGFVDYQRNSAETRKFLRSDSPLVTELHTVALEVADEARMIIEAEAYQTGALAASVDVERQDLTGRFARVGFAVTASDPAAAPIQFGNVHMPPDEVTTYLDDAADRIGLDVREAGLGD